MATDEKPALDILVAATDVHSFYARVCALGFGLIALTGIVVFIFGVLAGNVGENAGYALAYLVVGLIIAGVVWRFRSWAFVLAAVLALLLLGLTVSFSFFSLGHPEFAVDFIPLVMSLAGALLGLAGPVGALIQSQRKVPPAGPTRVEQLVLRGVLGLLAIVMLLSIVLTVTSHTVVSAAAKTGATSVQIKNFTFTPGSLLVSPGGTVRLVVKNDDVTLHTFTLPQAGVNVSVPPGSEKVIEFTAPAAGSYQWFCIPHSSANGATRAGMVGTLTVQ